jgi:hypothetical protein
MRAQTQTARQAPPTTTPRQRHGACHPKQQSPTIHARHIAHSHAAYKQTSPACPHYVLHNLNRCALRDHHLMHTAARTPPTARHTAKTTPHAAHRKSHPVTHAASAPHSRQSCQAAQRRRDAAGELVAVQEQLPAGHTNNHRVTPWQPTLPLTPASNAAQRSASQRITAQRITAHHIASITTCEKKASQHTACYRSRTTPCASDPPNDTTRQPTGT